MLPPWKKSYDQPRQYIKKQRHYFANKGLSGQSYGFYSSPGILTHPPLYSPVSPKGNQPWMFTGRTDAETEAPTLWPPNAKNWLIGKDFNAGQDWGQEGKQVTEVESIGWHHSTQWTWVWTNSGRYWRTGKPGMWQFMALQRVGHDLLTKPLMGAKGL